MTGIAIFDVDGTLVDTTYLHAVCWWQAFRQHGVDVPMARIHRAVGMGADQLVPHLLGRPPADAELSALDSAHGTLWRTWWPHVRQTHGARELLKGCAAAGWTVVLASSASEDELAAMREVIAADEVISAATDSSDVEQSKPHPELLHVAIRRAKGRPGDAVFVGDSIWDAKAALAAGVPFVGLLCGGTSEAELRAAGAAEVYPDPGAALAHLDGWPELRPTPPGAR